MSRYIYKAREYKYKNNEDKNLFRYLHQTTNLEQEFGVY